MLCVLGVWNRIVLLVPGNRYTMSRQKFATILLPSKIRSMKPGFCFTFAEFVDGLKFPAEAAAKLFLKSFRGFFGDMTPAEQAAQELAALDQETELHRAVERVRDLAQRLDEAAALHLSRGVTTAPRPVFGHSFGHGHHRERAFAGRVPFQPPTPSPPATASGLCTWCHSPGHVISDCPGNDHGIPGRSRYHPENNGAPSPFGYFHHRLPLSVADGTHAVRGTRLTCGFSKPVHHRLGFLPPLDPQLTTTVVVNGVSAPALLDTGAMISVISPALRMIWHYRSWRTARPVTLRLSPECKPQQAVLYHLGRDPLILVGLSELRGHGLVLGDTPTITPLNIPVDDDDNDLGDDDYGGEAIVGRLVLAGPLGALDSDGQPDLAALALAAPRIATLATPPSGPHLGKAAPTVPVVRRDVLTDPEAQQVTDLLGEYAHLFGDSPLPRGDGAFSGPALAWSQPYFPHSPLEQPDAIPFSVFTPFDIHVAWTLTPEVPRSTPMTPNTRGLSAQTGPQLTVDITRVSGRRYLPGYYVPSRRRLASGCETDRQKRSRSDSDQGPVDEFVDDSLSPAGQNEADEQGEEQDEHEDVAEQPTDVSEQPQPEPVPQKEPDLREPLLASKLESLNESCTSPSPITSSTNTITSSSKTQSTSTCLKISPSPTTDSKTEPRQNPTSTVTSPQAAAPRPRLPIGASPFQFAGMKQLVPSPGCSSPFDPAWRSSFDCSLFTANNPAAPSVSRHLNRGITVPVCFLQSFSEYHLDSGICVELHKVLNRLIGVFTSSIRVLTEGTCSNVTAVYRNLSARALAIAQNLEDEQAVGLHTPIEGPFSLEELVLWERAFPRYAQAVLRDRAQLRHSKFGPAFARALRPVRRNIWLSPRPTGRPTTGRFSARSIGPTRAGSTFRAIGNAS
ncbi:hypothetical protein PAPYR_11184 [Paratrimastix pyriformis]|uniref:Peptidase A2 domain-containing protein n=1 Tax=Paratrimastix pyriformis TaxID=342808 RepID=A0ABQ8U4C2_9EUKA|nr:hypothetical protein PAPYR_11184 [Paratrimastix pyriformis]